MYVVGGVDFWILNVLQLNTGMFWQENSNIKVGKSCFFIFKSFLCGNKFLGLKKYLKVSKRVHFSIKVG
jgi:hypothetical protein